MFQKFLVSKKFWIGGGGGREVLSTTSVESFLSHNTEKFVKETLPCFTNFLVSKKFIDKMGERKGVLMIFFGKFLSHSTETFLCF